MSFGERAMDIESKLWRVVSYNAAYAHITQKASGVIRTVSRSALPSVDALAQMKEQQFNRICREAFHGTKGE
jgi:hypothetical protein